MANKTSKQIRVHIQSHRKARLRAARLNCTIGAYVEKLILEDTHKLSTRRRK